MNKKTLITLAAITAGLLLLVVVSNGMRSGQGTVAEGVPLYENLDQQINDVTQVEIRGEADQQVSLALKDDQWVVTNRKDYPADVEKLRRELVKLGRARIVETKTSNPERYSLLSVQDIDKADAETRQIRLQDSQGNELAHLIIGDSSSQGGSNVRKVGDAQALLVSEAFYLSPEPRQWIKKKIIELASTRVHRVIVKPATGPAYTLVKTSRANTGYELEGRKDKLDAGMSSRVGSALNNLRAQDIYVEPPPSDGWKQARYETFDGVVVEVRTQKVGEDYLMTLSPSYDAELAAKFAPEHKDTEEDAEAAKKKQAEAVEKFKAEVKDMKARVEGWVYIGSEYDANMTSRTLEQLLKKAAK